jgi:hypothetical protein
MTRWLCVHVRGQAKGPLGRLMVFVSEDFAARRGLAEAALYELYLSAVLQEVVVYGVCGMHACMWVCMYVCGYGVFCGVCVCMHVCM